MSEQFDGLASLMSSPTTAAQSGTLTLADINTMFETLRNTRIEPDMFFISPTTRKRIIHWERVGRLHRAHPLPAYAIRKCVRRRIVAARQAGMRRIRKMEAREEQREREMIG